MNHIGMDNLKHLRSSGAYADLTLVCGSQKWPVHRCILFAASSQFKASYGCQPFEEGIIRLQSNENETSWVENEYFDPTDPELLSLMLDFIYLGDYNEAPGSVDQDPHAFIGEISDSQTLNLQILVDSDDNAEEAKFYSPPTSPVSSISTVLDSMTLRSAENSSVTPKTALERRNELALHIKMWRMGTDHQIQSLQNLALSKFKSATESRTYNKKEFADSLLLAWRIKVFGESAQTSLGAAILDVLERDIDSLIDSGPVKKAVKRIPGLGAAIIAKLARRQPLNRILAVRNHEGNDRLVAYKHR
ncbi:uncharacterized protein K489DRAFT_402347 [Dissoconium aciculare CBS 342.82]|uniref:BTB domain-containing protein n=1 Tax=Dissoconium aciculare CBS 342.82 TaxID=1314786 RepID=A0A6J3M0A2_9PEZI|nr:uncharacterized protein K489DRAFT_402347 [Dissoconium aciculare CBS 342.82]KAF1821441.1 hypothetical protein K489DRAFT_402347 [Dissoconium aciculare CBS 342.82]